MSGSSDGFLSRDVTTAFLKEMGTEALRSEALIMVNYGIVIGIAHIDEFENTVIRCFQWCSIL